MTDFVRQRTTGRRRRDGRGGDVRVLSRRGCSLAVLAAGLVAFAACGGSNDVTARGVVVVSERVQAGMPTDSVIDLAGPPRACSGTGPYSDLVEGQSIVVRGHGAILGSGQLGPGTASIRDPATGRRHPLTLPIPTTTTGTVSCTLSFEIPNVDAGSDHYRVAIGDRVPLLSVRRAALRGMVLRMHG